MNLKNPNLPALIITVALILIGIPNSFNGGLSTLSKAPDTIPTSLGFAAAYLIIFLALFRFTRIWPKGSIWWLIGALGWGAFAVNLYVSLAGAGLANLMKQLGMPIFAGSFAGAFPEEIGKFIGVLLIALVAKNITKPWHVFMLGIFVGVGFILTENIGYGASGAMVDPTSDTTGALNMWMMRTKAGFGLHAIYTSIATWGLAQALFQPTWSTARKISTSLGWLTVGFLLHFTWNSSPADPIINLIKLGVTAIISYGLFLWLFLKCRRLAKQDAETTQVTQAPETTPVA